MSKLLENFRKYILILLTLCDIIGTWIRKLIQEIKLIGGQFYENQKNHRNTNI